MIRIAVVEDLEDEARQLTKCIEQYGREKNEVFAVERFSDGLAFMEGYEPRYDIIFMDINMPLMSGLSAAKRLRVVDPSVCLIFVTQMAQYALNGYEVGASDYILKPVTYGSFALRFDRAVASAKGRQHHAVLLKTQSGLSRIDTNSICYVEVNKHLVVYHTVNGDLESWESLKRWRKSWGPWLEAACPLQQLFSGQSALCK